MLYGIGAIYSKLAKYGLFKPFYLYFFQLVRLGPYSTSDLMGWYNIPLLPNARFRARPRWTRCPAKRHEAKVHLKRLVVIRVELNFKRRRIFILKYERTTCFETIFLFFVDVINVFIPFMHIFLPNNNVMFLKETI